MRKKKKKISLIIPLFIIILLLIACSIGIFTHIQNKKTQIADNDTEVITKLAISITDSWKIPDLKYDVSIKKRVGDYVLVFVTPTNQTLDPLQIIFAKEQGKWVYKEMGSYFPDWEQKIPELFK